MIEHDDALLDNLAALAMGDPFAPDSAPLREHAAACERCKSLLARFRAAADLVCLSAASSDELPPVSAPRLKQRILSAALGRRKAAEPPPAVALAPGISWSVERADGFTVVNWVFDPPACGLIPLEVHEPKQWGSVLKGSVELHFSGGVRRKFVAGQSYSIAPGVAHGGSFEEQTVLFEIYTPNFEEYERRYRAGLRGL